jgi:inhibitor of cysteine peptidase
MAWTILKKTFRRPATHTRRRPKLAVEPLEDRCLLDGTPVQFGSADAFKQYLVNTALAQYQNLFGQTFNNAYYPPIFDLALGAPAAFTATLDTTQAAVGGGFSQTNVQVQGVDEADFVKTDGQFIYDLRYDDSGTELVIVAAGPGNAMQITSRIPIEGYSVAEYVIGDRVTVISNVYDASVDPRLGLRSQDGFPLIREFFGKTKVTVFDVSDRSHPQVLSATYVDGYNVTSRAIGNDIYLVNQNYVTGLPAPAYTFFNGTTIYETQDQYLARIAGHEIDLALPHLYTRPGGPGTPLQAVGLVSDPAQIYEPLTPNADDLLSVFSLDVSAAQPQLSPATSILASYASTVFASPTHLYVAMPHWATDGSGNSTTDVLQFSLNGSQVSLTAAGSVSGQVLNQFWMDENGHYFRIVTTANWGANATNNLFVMTVDGTNLKIVGSLVDLAHGEQVRAVRFLADRAFVVTFRQIDPLFGVDLSVANLPIVVGQLHLPGYSSYLQPIDNNHLLGIGRAASGGLGLDLFDVTSLSNSTLVDQYVINPPQWNWWWGPSSEAEWDHHAVGWFPEFHTLAIPVYGIYTDYNYSSFQSSLWVFNVDTTTGFSKLGQVNQDSQVRRSLQIGDRLYSVADNSIKVQAIQDPGGVNAELRFIDDPRAPIFSPAITAAGAAESVAVVNFVVSDSTGLQATIDWGDTQTSSGTIVNEANGRYTVMGSHTYARADQYNTSVWFSRGQTNAGRLLGITQVAGISQQTLHLVQQLYRDLLHREADFVGVTNWGGMIDSQQATRAQVALDIATSVEYRTDLVQDLYQSLLGRPADPVGLNTFVGWLSEGLTTEQVKQTIIDSPEYYQHAGGTAAAFLNSVYFDVLGRAPDPVGENAFGDQLADPSSRALVVDMIVASPEAQRRTIDNYYELLLHRSADQFGLENFATAMSMGMRDEAILAIIAGSDEYLSLV